MRKIELIAKHYEALKELESYGESAGTHTIRFNLYKRYKELMDLEFEDKKEVIKRLEKEFGYSKNSIQTYLCDMKKRVSKLTSS